MKLIIVLTLFFMIFLSILDDKKIKTNSHDYLKQIKELEYLKNLEINKFNKERYEILKQLYDNNNKEVKESELKYKLSEFDMLISKIILDNFK